MENITSAEVKKPSKFAKWSLMIGIVIVLNMFFNYAISLVYKNPEYPSAPQVVGDIQTKEDCLLVGGQWTENTIAPTPEEIKSKTSARLGYCDPDYTKRQQYEDARKVYNRNVFIVLVVLGILSIIGGVVASQEVIAVSFAWGGVLSLLIASMRYWSDAGNLVKVLILAIALGGLIWVAVKKFSK